MQLETTLRIFYCVFMLYAIVGGLAVDTFITGIFYESEDLKERDKLLKYQGYNIWVQGLCLALAVIILIIDLCFDIDIVI